MSDLGQFILDHKEGSENALQNAPHWKRNSISSGYAILIIDDEFREVLRSIKDEEILHEVEPETIRKHCNTLINNYEEIELIILSGFQLIGKKDSEGPCYNNPPSIINDHIKNNHILVLLDYVYEDSGEIIDDTFGVDIYNRLTNRWGINKNTIAFYTRFPDKVKEEFSALEPIFVWKETGKVSDANKQIYKFEDWLNLMIKIDVCEEILNAVVTVWKDEGCNRGHDSLPKTYPLEDEFEFAWGGNFRDSECKKAIFHQGAKELSVVVSNELACYSWDIDERKCRADALCQLINRMITKDKDIRGDVKVVCDKSIHDSIISLPCSPGIIFIYWILMLLRNLNNYSGELKLSVYSDRINCLTLSINCPHEIFGKFVTREMGNGQAVSSLRSLLQCIIPHQKLKDIGCVQSNSIMEETGLRKGSWVAPVVELRIGKNELLFLWDGFCEEYKKHE